MASVTEELDFKFLFLFKWAHVTGGYHLGSTALASGILDRREEGPASHTPVESVINAVNNLC